MKKTFALVVVVVVFSGCGFRYSDGYRAGVVRKFSKKGVFVKTWEGEMLLNYSANEQGAVVPEVWEFSVHADNPNEYQVASDIEKALEKGERVKLHYAERLYFWPFNGNTGYFIEKVEKL